MTINRALWMFNFDLHHHGAGVFWAIGWSMVVLSALVYLPTPVVTVFGVAMIVLHNLLDGLTADDVHLPGWLWIILHSPGDGPVVRRLHVRDRLLPDPVGRGDGRRVRVRRRCSCSTARPAGGGCSCSAAS